MNSKKKALTASEMGKLGAKALHAKFNAKERSERARRMAQARWDKVKKNTK